MYKKTVRRRRATLGLLVVLSLILLSASIGSGSPGGPLGAIQAGFLDIFTPIEDGANILLTPVHDLIRGVDNVANASHERDVYHAENRRLLAQNAALEADRRELQQLRSQFTLDRELGLASYQQVVAQVSDEAPSVWYSHVTIDAGGDAGIRSGDVVIDGDGLVGRVSAVAGAAAEVTLLTDASFAVDARDAGSGVWGIVEPAAGGGNDLVLDFASGSNIAVGDSIVTAGTGRSQFPPDIPIGRVASIDPTTQTIVVSPYANVRQLEDVLVLTHPKASAGAAATAARPPRQSTGVTGTTGSALTGGRR